jgi:hypothetical protein
MTASINASTSAGLIQTADTSGDLALQSNGTTKLTVSSTGTYGQLVSGTVQASTSGTAIDFTGIPSWVKRITIMLNGVSTNSTSYMLVQVGSSTISTSGYAGSCSSGGGLATNSTAGFIIAYNITAAASTSGQIVLTTLGSNIWCESGIAAAPTLLGNYSTGTVTLSGALDRVRITTVNGTDTFDAGSINILYEG